MDKQLLPISTLVIGLKSTPNLLMMMEEWIKANPNDDSMIKAFTSLTALQQGEQLPRMK
jgi:hypothetical protein